MDSIDLTFFSAVAVAGGMGRAANDLNTVQSNVTQRIRALELQLGVQLFHRSTKGVTLTSMGNRLLPYAMRIGDLLIEAKRAVRDEVSPSGDLRIGSLETTAALRLPPILTRYAQACPDVDLQIETGPTEPLIERVLTRKLDGAFVSGPVAHDDLIAVAIVEEELVLVTAPWMETHQNVSDYLASPTGRKVIVFRAGCSYRQRVSEYLAHAGVVDVRWMEMGTLDGIIGCIAASVGVSLLPRVVVESAERQGLVRIHAIGSRSGKAMTVFVRRRDTFVTAALHSFIACARGENPALPSQHGDPIATGRQIDQPSKRVKRTSP